MSRSFGTRLCEGALARDEGKNDLACLGDSGSLWQARERAAAEGKPILLWEMDGHPLGCT